MKRLGQLLSSALLISASSAPAAIFDFGGPVLPASFENPLSGGPEKAFRIGDLNFFASHNVYLGAAKSGLGILYDMGSSARIMPAIPGKKLWIDGMTLFNWSWPHSVSFSTGKQSFTIYEEEWVRNANGTYTYEFKGEIKNADFLSFGIGTSEGGISIENLSYRWLTVPEPSTWGMMLAGFAALGGALRARPRASWGKGQQTAA